MHGSSCCERKKAPSRLTCMIRRHSARSVSTHLLLESKPALFTRTETAPRRVRMVWHTSSTAGADEISTVKGWKRSALSSRRVFNPARPSVLMSRAATRNPSSSSMRVMDSPNVPAAPVTMAICVRDVGKGSGVEGRGGGRIPSGLLEADCKLHQVVEGRRWQSEAYRQRMVHGK